MGRISSVEKSLHGTHSPSPIPGRRGSSPSPETMNVSVPPTSGYLVPLSQSQVIRNERLLLKPRPDYRLWNRSTIWQDRSIIEVDEDAEYDDPAPIRRGTQLRTVAGEMTFRRGPGDIVNRDIDREGQDVVIKTQRVGPEVNIDLANNPLHPPNTSFRVAPEVEESIRREDVRRYRMSRTLMDTERKRNKSRPTLMSEYTLLKTEQVKEFGYLVSRMITNDAKRHMEIKRRIVIEEETFSKTKELLRGKLDRNQKKRTIKTSAMECHAV